MRSVVVAAPVDAVTTVNSLMPSQLAFAREEHKIATATVNRRWGRARSVGERARERVREARRKGAVKDWDVDDA